VLDCAVDPDEIAVGPFVLIKGIGIVASVQVTRIAAEQGIGINTASAEAAKTMQTTVE
jgi:hypothetical protein